MGKTQLIIWREYWTRVRKPSFIIMSILGPLLIASTFIIPLLIKQNNFKTIYVEVVDYTHSIGQHLDYYNSDHVVYLHHYQDKNHNEAIDKFRHSDDTVVVLLKANFMEIGGVDLFHKNHPGLNTVTKLKKDLQDIRIKWAVHDVSNLNLVALDKFLKEIKVNFHTEDLSLEVKIFSGIVAGMLMYILIMLYGVQVMRGIMEEKTNRIVEIIISSVKPLQLLYGKIIGVAMAGLTQFIILIIVMFTLFVSAKNYFVTATIQKAHEQVATLQSQGQKNMDNEVVMTQQVEEKSVSDQEIIEFLEELKNLVPKMILFFPLFFLGGYLLYSAFYAIIGSAVDAETETQQFALPVTLPIIAGIIIATNIYENPNGDLAFWSSLIPLTSPIVMLARLPFMDLSTQWWEVLTALILLYVSFVFATKMAAKIYRTGILMYGQKASYKTIFKWLKYKS